MELTTKAFIVTCLILPVYHVFCLWRNYLKARKIGLPIVIVPFSPTNPIWVISGNVVFALLQRIGLDRVLRFGHIGWQFLEKAQPHLEMGSAFVEVTPDKLWIDLADPDGLTQIFQGERKGSLERPYEGIKMLDVFGPNISTAAGDNWARMRRLTVTSFNDNTNQVVWNESMRQGRQMIAKWLAAGASGITSTADDTRTFALNIMLGAGFGKVYDFNTAPTPEDANSSKGPNSMDYRQALRLVLKNAVLIIALGPKMIPKLGWMGNSMKTIGNALVTYQQYMTDMLKEGTMGGKEEVRSQGNLLATLVRASVQDKQLSQPEVFGNMFVYTFGGHDTTAHSLAFTFTILSIYPEVQEWMREELHTVFKDSDPSTWKYEDFGRLKRTHAVQLEILRLYNPLLGIVKGTLPDKPVQLTLDGGKRTVTVPGDVCMTININAIHAHPQYWGEDAMEWRPSRFIQVDGNGEEQLITPAKGTFQPWSDGIRVCPGKKFGQVEHIALMTSIFYGHKVEPFMEKGESMEQTRKRIMGVVHDSGWALNIQMHHPENARLVWKKC